MSTQGEHYDGAMEAPTIAPAEDPATEAFLVRLRAAAAEYYHQDLAHALHIGLGTVRHWIYGEFVPRAYAVDSLQRKLERFLKARMKQQTKKI